MYYVIFSDTEHSDTGSNMSESACYSVGGGKVCVHVSDFQETSSIYDDITANYEHGELSTV